MNDRANQSLWQRRYRQLQIARYAFWRTRYRHRWATGTQAFCLSCRFYARNEWLVCSLKPTGPAVTSCNEYCHITSSETLDELRGKR
ncbi:MAG: hypothetical protein HC926_00415 [Synechococcaceae cyanobacterium SM2_3_60]|nr:hypothetical protein [Synechococcaceae cyanobacterium SM2_3_60]